MQEKNLNEKLNLFLIETEIRMHMKKILQEQELMITTEQIVKKESKRNSC
jgi:hypothetical protein